MSIKLIACLEETSLCNSGVDMTTAVPNGESAELPIVKGRWLLQNNPLQSEGPDKGASLEELLSPAQQMNNVECQ